MRRRVTLRIEKEFVVKASPAQVWGLLWNIPMVAECIPGCEGARETDDPNRYEATIAERVGPFRVQFELEINVTEVEPEKRIVATASGKDRRLGSGIGVDLELSLSPVVGEEADGESGENGGTQVTVVSTTRVQGKLATLGHAMMRRKVEDNISKFAAALEQRLTPGGE